MHSSPRRSSTVLFLLATSAITTLVAGCGGGGGSGGSSAGGGGTTGGACSESARKQWVLNVTREWYLFPDLLPASVDLAAYATAEDLLDALTATARAQGKDRFFSYLTTIAEETSILGEGQFVGFGFRNRTDPGNRPFILDVFETSPAFEAGLQRGDEVVAVDAGSGFVPVSTSLANGSTFSDLLGPADAGVRRGLRVLRNGATLDVSLTKRTVTIDPVPDSFGTRVLPRAGTTGVGYLHLRSYISTADPQLRAAFDNVPRARRARFHHRPALQRRRPRRHLRTDQQPAGRRPHRARNAVLFRLQRGEGRAELHRALRDATAIGAPGAHRVPHHGRDRVGERDQRQFDADRGSRRPSSAATRSASPSANWRSTCPAVARTACDW